MSKDFTHRKSNFTVTRNPYWSLLHEANGFHVTATERHHRLLEKLRMDGVAFKDIKNRLMKEAKRAGLYCRTMYVGDTREYPPVKSLRANKISWFIALENFMRWTHRNYSAYGVKTDFNTTNQKSRSKVDSKKKVTTITRKKVTADGKEEVRTEVVGATRKELTGKDAEDTSGDKAKKVVPITSPLTTELTTIQKQVLVFQNLHILGAKAQEKGCLELFNALMVGMGADEEVIEVDEFSNGGIMPESWSVV